MNPIGREAFSRRGERASYIQNLQIPMELSHRRASSFARRRLGGPLSLNENGAASRPTTAIIFRPCPTDWQYGRRFEIELDSLPAKISAADNHGLAKDAQEVWFREKDAITYMVAKPVSRNMHFRFMSFFGFAFTLGSLIYAIEFWLRA